MMLLVYWALLLPCVRGWSVAHRAARFGATAVLDSFSAEELLSSAAGVTPAHVAARHGHADVLRVLATKGAVNDVSSLCGVATQNGHLEVVETLAELHLVKPKDALRQAVLQGVLIPGLIDADEYIAHFAAHHDAFHALAAMTEKHAVLKDGELPIHVASRLGHARSVESLLLNSTHIDARTNDSATPAMLAARSGHAEVLAALKRRGADFTLVDADGRTAAHHAALGGHLGTTMDLLVVDAETVRIAAVYVARHAGSPLSPRAWSFPLLLVGNLGLFLVVVVVVVVVVVMTRRRRPTTSSSSQSDSLSEAAAADVERVREAEALSERTVKLARRLELDASRRLSAAQARIEELEDASKRLTAALTRIEELEALSAEQEEERLTAAQTGVEALRAAEQEEKRLAAAQTRIEELEALRSADLEERRLAAAQTRSEELEGLRSAEKIAAAQTRSAEQIAAAQARIGELEGLRSAEQEEFARVRSEQTRRLEAAKARHDRELAKSVASVGAVQLDRSILSCLAELADNDVTLLSALALKKAVDALPRVSLAVTREHLRREFESTSMEATDCIVCLASPRRVAFGCGHLCVCDNCSRTVDYCPVCRTEIQERRRIFHP